MNAEQRLIYERSGDLAREKQSRISMNYRSLNYAMLVFDHGGVADVKICNFHLLT